METAISKRLTQESPASESRGQILIIEDNAKNRKLVRSLLKINKFDVLEATDAESGINVAKECRPDLILMDIQLPGMDGLQATRIIRTTPEIQGIKIVALTSHAMEGDSDKAMAAGCDGYLTKPIDTRKFVNAITPFLSQKANVAEPAMPQIDSTAPALLIVDDEPMNLKLLHGKLLKDYPNIIEASNGHEAIEKANKLQPDLILLDVMMPGLDGFEVTRQLKASQKTKDIPIILITALDGHDYKVMGYEAGADDFLNKPINTFELLTRTKSLLNMKKCHDQLAFNALSDQSVCHAGPAEDHLGFPNQKILIMLKDIGELKKLKMYLFGQPYEIRFEDNLGNAADSILEDDPDILIANSQLSVEELKELRHNTKSDQRAANFQILYLTTEQDLELNYSRYENVVDDFLTHPFNISELRARIKVLLKKKAFLDRLFNCPETNLQHVITDKLTSLYNFEYCKHVLKHEIQRSIREHCTVTLVMMAVHEQLFSHDAVVNADGDSFFAELGKLINNSIRKLDVASRRSNGIFAFVLPETDGEKVHGFVQRMRGLIRSKMPEIHRSGQTSESLFCFGHAVCPDDSDQLDELIKIADASMEKNKSTSFTPIMKSS